MYQSYDEYIEATTPRYTIKCPHCGRAYYSDDADDWYDEHGETYTAKPVAGGTCLLCEADEAHRNPRHWAAMEVLSRSKNLERLFKYALGQMNDAERLETLKTLLNNETFYAEAEEYLDGCYGDVYSEIESTL